MKLFNATFDQSKVLIDDRPKDTNFYPIRTTIVAAGVIGFILFLGLGAPIICLIGIVSFVVTLLTLPKYFSLLADKGFYVGSACAGIVIIWLVFEMMYLFGKATIQHGTSWALVLATWLVTCTVTFILAIGQVRQLMNQMYGGSETTISHLNRLFIKIVSGFWGFYVVYKVFLQRFISTEQFSDSLSLFGPALIPFAVCLILPFVIGLNQFRWVMLGYYCSKYPEQYRKAFGESPERFYGKKWEEKITDSAILKSISAEQREKEND